MRNGRPAAPRALRVQFWEGVRLGLGVAAAGVRNVSTAATRSATSRYWKQTKTARRRTTTKPGNLVGDTLGLDVPNAPICTELPY
jgi:hypothetical protein